MLFQRNTSKNMLSLAVWGRNENEMGIKEMKMGGRHRDKEKSKKGGEQNRKRKTEEGRFRSRWWEGEKEKGRPKQRERERATEAESLTETTGMESLTQMKLHIEMLRNTFWKKGSALKERPDQRPYTEILWDTAEKSISWGDMALSPFCPFLKDWL